MVVFVVGLGVTVILNAIQKKRPMMMSFGHFSLVWLDLTAHRTAKIIATTASQCAAPLPLLSVLLPVACPARGSRVMVTHSPLDCRLE